MTACGSGILRVADSASRVASVQEQADMATQTLARAEQDQGVERKIQQLRELFAEAPQLGKTALENALRELKSQASDLPPA